MERSVIVYGAGAMGKATVKILHTFKKKIKCIIDRNPDVSGTFYNDIPIFYPDTLDKILIMNCDVIVSISARPYYEIEEYLFNLGARHIYPSGDYIQKLNENIKWANVWSMTQSKKELLLKQNELMFFDDKSKLDYRIALEWFCSRNEKELVKDSFFMDRNKYFPDFVVNKLGKKKVMLDTSVMSGEYTDKFFEIVQNGYVYSFIMHPNVVKPFEIYRSNLKIEDKELYRYSGKLKSVRNGIMEPFTSFDEYSFDVVSVDEYFEYIPYDFFRVYSMSYVKDILIGAISTINKYRPIIAVNIGHYEDDFSDVPLMLYKYCRNYSFYFRIHSFQGNDCIFYAIPN